MQLNKKRQTDASGQPMALSAADLEKVYTANFPVVRAYVLSNSGTEEDAKDIFQETMVSAWVNVRNGRYSGSVDSIGGYLYTIAKHKWLDKLKSTANRSTMRIETEEVNDIETSVEDTLSSERIVYLQGLVDSLGEKCQKILKQFYYDSNSLREIAAQLDTDEQSMRTMKYRCMKTLRQLHVAKQTRES